MAPAVTRPALPIIGDKYWIAALVVLVLGIGSYVWSALTEGIQASVLSGLGSAFVALGIVTIISDWLLKRAFTADLLDLIGLKQDIYNSGIVQLTDESDFSWGAFVGSAKHVEAVILSPSRWRATVWPHLLKSARKPGGLDITVAFIDPTKAATVRYAAKLSREEHTTYSRQIEREAERLEQEWKAIHQGSRASDVSSLTVHFLQHVPPYSAVHADSATCIVLPPLYPDAGAQEGTCIVFREMAGAVTPYEWSTEGIRQLTRTSPAPQYTNHRVDKEDGANR